MKTKTFFPSYIHYLILFIASIVFAVTLDIGMLDDGLRHISFAAHKDVMVSWGDVFPYSLFTDYDPWLLWHKFLELLLQFVPYELVHIPVNILALFVLMILIHNHILKEATYDFASLIYIIVFSITLLTSYRYTIIRPDLLSGLFVLLILFLRNRFLPIFILTLCYGPFYYLFFMYTGSLGLVYMIQRKWNAFLGLFIASLIVGIYFLVQGGQEYINVVINILTDQKLRMGLEVGEGEPLFGILTNINYYVLLLIFLGGASGIIYWKYSYFKANILATFLIVTSILWVNQYRYYQIFSPIIMIYAFSILVNADKKLFIKWVRKYFILTKRYFSYAKKRPLFYVIAIPYLIAIFAFGYKSHSYNKILEEAQFFKNEKYKNKTILFNVLNIDKYKALYYNPTIKIVPSCSIGWFDNSDPIMKDIYIRMQKDIGISEEELFSLVKYVNADLYIHYLRNKEQVLNFEKLNKFGIIPEEIYHNRIIFKIEKNKSVKYE